MKRVKIEVEVDITEDESFYDVIDLLEDALDEEYSIYETRLVTIDRV